MAVTINASTSSGLVQSADTSGQIELQTNGTTVATVNTSNNVKFKSSISVGDATPTTSGAGITFPATQSASTDANTLDDYEEGSWTPSLFYNSGGSTGVTYSSVRTGIYTKVGNIVSVQGVIQLTNKGTGTGIAFITGLPFVIPNTAMYSGGAIGYTEGFTTNAPNTAYIDANTTRVVLYNFVSGYITDANITNTSYVGFQCTYRVA